MKRTLSVACGLAVLAVLFAAPGTVAAAGDGDGNGNGTVGICVVGVESPCNGASGDSIDTGEPATSDNASRVDAEPIQFHPDELPYASGVADDDAPIDSNNHTDDGEGDGDPIQFHPDELPYASGMAGEETPDALEGERSEDGLLDRIPGLRLLLGFLAGLF